MMKIEKAGRDERFLHLKRVHAPYFYTQTPPTFAKIIFPMDKHCAKNRI